MASRDKRYWLRKFKGRNPSPSLKKDREEQIRDNQWGSKDLIEELFLDNPTDNSQLYLYRRSEGRADGAFFKPVRININDLREFMFPACFDEGNATTVYDPENIYDEGDSGSVITEFIWDEGDAGFVPTSCDLIPEAGIATAVTQPIINISSNTTLAEERYYRITGGTTMTITAASGVYDPVSVFSMTIKNVSGASVTIDASGADTFYSTGGTVTNFNLSDGELATLIATTSTNYDIR